MIENSCTLTVFVDRIESGFAVLILRDVLTQFDLPLKYLPPGTKEGDALRMTFEAAPEAAEESRAEIDRLRKELAGNEGNQKHFKL